MSPHTGISHLHLAVLTLMVLYSSTVQSAEEVMSTTPANPSQRRNGSELETQALQEQKPCGEEHAGFCMNGVCAYVEDLDRPTCMCQPSYSGTRCEQVLLTLQTGPNVEEIIAISCGVTLLLCCMAIISYCCIKRRCQKPPLPYKTCGSENSV